MKHGNKFFIQVSREPFKSKYHLSMGALALFYALNELEMIYTSNGSEDSEFYHSNEEMCKMLNCSEPTLRKARKELEDAGLIITWKGSKPKAAREKETDIITWYKILV